jgi:EpsI family protein
LPGSGWEVWDAATVDVPVGGRSVRLNKYTVYNGSRRLIVIYWYHSSNRIIASEYWGKICLVFDAISGNHTGGSIVRLALSDQPGALEDGMAFASALIPQIEKRLRP